LKTTFPIRLDMYI